MMIMLITMVQSKKVWLKKMVIHEVINEVIL